MCKKKKQGVRDLKTQLSFVERPGDLKTEGVDQEEDLETSLRLSFLNGHTAETMSLPRNGTLEKTTSEARPSSRAGSALVVPPPYEAPGGPLELRGSLDCWACSVLVTVQNLLVALINGGLASIIFGVILTPALVMITFGFLCHSTVQPHGTSLYCSDDLLDDTSCVALLVVGFLLLTPLLVLALAAYCRLARHLQLGMCFIPYSRAVYKNLPTSRQRGPDAGGCCGQKEGKERDGKGSVWV